MPDNRQHALNTAAETIKASGASVCSIIAEWPDKERKTVVLIMDVAEHLDPWKNQRVVKSKKKKHMRG